MLGTVGRGNAMEIGTYVEAALASEMSGNVVDLCPVGALTAKPSAFAARSWEYRSTPSVDVLDMCGPSIKVDTAKGEVMRIQPRLNEAINEEWISGCCCCCCCCRARPQPRRRRPYIYSHTHTRIPRSCSVLTHPPRFKTSDKTRFAVDGLKRQRLDSPMLRTPGGSLEPVSWSQALSVAAHQLTTAPKGTVGALAGSLVEVEALVCAKDLLNSVGSCATSGTGGAISADLRGGYVFSATIAGVEEADALLLVGTNPRVEAPLVNARIRKMVRHASLPVASVGPAADLTYDYDHLGGGADAIEALLDGTSPFSATLKGATKPLVLVGAAALGRTDGDAIGAATRAIAAQAGCLTDGWNGYSVLASDSSAVGALDVGFVPGPSAPKLADLKVVYLLGADDAPLDAIAPDAYVIYQVITH